MTMEAALRCFVAVTVALTVACAGLVVARWHADRAVVEEHLGNGVRASFAGR